MSSITSTENITSTEVDVFKFLEGFKQFVCPAGDGENTQKNGKVFEDFVKKKLISLGYNDVPSEGKDKYKKVLTNIRKNYINHRSISNDDNTESEKLLIQQPYGSQAPPDILLIDITPDQIYFQPIEIKTGKKVATWNNNYPKDDWIYIFSGKEGVTYFRGKSLISEEEKQILEEHKMARKKLNEEHNKQLRAMNARWKLVDYFKFEHSAGVDYMKDGECSKRETEVSDILSCFANLSIQNNRPESEESTNEKEKSKSDSETDVDKEKQSTPEEESIV